MNKFGERLKELRIKNNLTQGQLAESIGIARNSIFSYETGRRTPDIDTLDKIARYFEVTADYLLGFSENSHKNKKDEFDGFDCFSNESLEVLMQLKNVLTKPIKSGMSLEAMKDGNSKKEAMQQILALNALISSDNLLKIIGKYLGNDFDDFIFPIAEMYDEYDGDCNPIPVDEGIINEINEYNQAILMYRIQKELIKLYEKINQEDKKTPNADKKD